ncbi:MAG: hypothetical protein HFE63_10305 [Clostridiales bacterium]|nr:hypothetical protein [Clostridiales bacterium]
MKKFVSTMLLASMLSVSAFGMAVSAAESGTAYGKVPATDEKITVDGKKDDIYDKGLSVKIDVPVSGASTGTTGDAKILWNGDNTIYVYVEVKDKEVIKYDGTPNAWETDSVELFLDYSNKVARTRDQYRIDIRNQATYYDTKTYTNDECKAFGFENWAVSDTADGYAVEFELKAYNESIKPNMNIGFHLMINDMVEGNTRYMYDSDACSNNPDKFGYITLSADKVANPAPEAPAASASTADMGAVISLAALAVSAGAIVALKKRK